jgi:hypothetical protein
MTERGRPRLLLGPTPTERRRKSRWGSAMRFESGRGHPLSLLVAALPHRDLLRHHQFARLLLQSLSVLLVLDPRAVDGHSYTGRNVMEGLLGGLSRLGADDLVHARLLHRSVARHFGHGDGAFVADESGISGGRWRQLRRLARSVNPANPRRLCPRGRRCSRGEEESPCLDWGCEGRVARSSLGRIFNPGGGGRILSPQSPYRSGRLAARRWDHEPTGYHHFQRLCLGLFLAFIVLEWLGTTPYSGYSSTASITFPPWWMCRPCCCPERGVKAA